MSFRLVVLDMDGTLLTDKKTITPRTKIAIQKALQRGVKVVLATARPFCSARPFAEDLGLNTPLVCYNGALVRNMPDGELASQTPIPTAISAEMARFCQQRGLYMKVFGDDIFHVQTETEETLRYSPRYGVPYKAVGNMPEFIENRGLEPYSFVVHGHPEEIPGLKQEMEVLWSGEIIGDCPNEHAIHFTSSRTSKLEVVRNLAERWDISPEETLAIGNGGNDLGVILWAGLGIAVANSPDDLLAKADRVTASNNDEGVALALEEHLLLEGVA